MQFPRIPLFATLAGALLLSSTFVAQADSDLSGEMAKAIKRQEGSVFGYVTRPYSSGTEAAKQLAALCITHRKSVMGLTSALRAQGYEKGGRIEGRSLRAWIHTEKPPVFLETGGGAVQGCYLVLDKPAPAFGSIGSALKQLTGGMTQEIPDKMLNGSKGERGWVVQPGYDYMILLSNVDERSILVMTRAE
ncbi:hypothetical protein [Albibacillus kandeliae]|uniref:hypothetical protein n=1 Tax=Albibacillus kandeliae TaxID=2174228 RepID=UPI000D692451|nr:hypothetical protein [Albibacillus kandeliae]